MGSVVGLNGSGVVGVISVLGNFNANGCGGLVDFGSWPNYFNNFWLQIFTLKK